MSRRPAPADFLVPVTIHLPRDVYADLMGAYQTHSVNPSLLAAAILTDTVRKARSSRQAAATEPPSVAPSTPV